MIRRGAKLGIPIRGSFNRGLPLVVDWIRAERIVSSSSTTLVVEDDAVLEVHDPATVDHEAQAVVVGSVGALPDFATSDPSIATIDADGRITRVSDGHVRIIATSGAGRKFHSQSIHIYRGSGETAAQLDEWVEGSLARHCSQAIDGRIAGLDPAAALAVFATQDQAGGMYVRNPDCWAAGLDLTGISPWNSSGSHQRAGTLISPRHLLFSEHYRIGVGATVRFVRQNNTVVERTMTARQDVGDPNDQDGYATDLCIGLLDSDVPAGITHYAVAPPTLPDYLPGVRWGIPTLGLDQEEKALVQELYLFGAMKAFRTPGDGQWAAFYEPKVTGDSGNPAFLLIDDRPVLLTTWTYGGAGSGPSLKRLHDEINAAMASLGGGYQLDVADLSGFPTYT